MWEWDDGAQVYRNTSTGEILTVDDLSDMIDDIIDGGIEESNELALLLEDGQLTTEQWRRRMASLITSLFLILAFLAAGGREMITLSMQDEMDRQLDRQFRFLDSFAVQIAAGVLSFGAIRRRARMYINSSRQSFWSVRDRKELSRGMIEENWEAVGDKNTCTPCDEADLEGWRWIGSYGQPGSGIVSLIPLTLCAGMTACRCRKSYR